MCLYVIVFNLVFNFKSVKYYFKYIEYFFYISQDDIDCLIWFCSNIFVYVVLQLYNCVLGQDDNYFKFLKEIIQIFIYFRIILNNLLMGICINFFFVNINCKQKFYFG